MKRSTVMGLLALAVLTATLPACVEAPITGRKQLMLLSATQENELGEQAYAEVLKESRASSNAAARAVLERVGRRIAAVAHQPDFQWDFTLIESDQANAFALPGGKVAIYTGIFPLCKNEAGLAAVVGHEVAHAVLRHGGERISQNLVVQLLGVGISEAMSESNPELRSGVLAAFGAGTTVGVLLPFSRTHENEADEVGMRFMARAGYDPSEAPALWERMAEQSGASPPEFLSTHPAHETRIARLRQLVPAMRAQYERAPMQYGAGETLPAVAPPPSR